MDTSDRRFLLLAAVVAVGVVAWMGIPEFLVARNRSRQKRTMAEVRTWAVVIEKAVAAHQVSSATSGTSGELLALGRKHGLTGIDGWGTPLRMRIAKGTYVVHAAARDGKFEEVVRAGQTTGFDRDIVFSDGAFVTFPEGI